MTKLQKITEENSCLFYFRKITNSGFGFPEKPDPIFHPSIDNFNLKNVIFFSFSVQWKEIYLKNACYWIERFFSLLNLVEVLEIKFIKNRLFPTILSMPTINP